eukprot:Opistho-2@80508
MGLSDATSRVSVTLGSAHTTTATAITAADGKWEVEFDKMPHGGPHQLTVSIVDDSTSDLDDLTIVLYNVMIGDVFFLFGAIQHANYCGRHIERNGRNSRLDKLPQ